MIPQPIVRLNVLAAVPLIKKLFNKSESAQSQAQSKTAPLPMQPMMLLGGNTQAQTPTLHLEVKLKKANNTEEILFTQGFVTTENWRNFTQVLEIGRDKLADCEEGELILKWYSHVQTTTPTVWVDEVRAERSSLEVMTWADYYPYGLVMREGTCDSYRYQYQGETAEKDKETGWNHFELREYESVIGRWLSKDPKHQYHSPYVGMGNNPVSGIDPDGGETNDWYKNKKTGAVTWIDGSNKNVAGHEWLGADALALNVSRAIGADIMNRGWDAFISYFENPRLGENFFFDASKFYPSANIPPGGIIDFFAHPIGWLLGWDIGDDNYVRAGAQLSQMTHDWVDNNGGQIKNRLEHNIGMFLISSRYSPDAAELVGYGNEARGLFVTDVGRGDFWNAIMGKPRNPDALGRTGPTAFEWSDLDHNREGIKMWYIYQINRTWRNYVNSVHLRTTD